MRTSHLFRSLLRCLPPIALVAGAHAASTDISTAPLVTSAPQAVLPNMMFVLDDSGSMDSDYLPDWVNDSFCRSSGATSTNSGNFGLSCVGQPPYRSIDFNGVYYSPGITYKPPVNSAGTSLPTQNAANTAGWTSVKNDAYNIQDTGSTNLLTSYPDTEWCTDSTYTNCLRNGNYVLPGSVGGVSYTTRHATTATSNGLMAIGAPDAATTQAQAWGPNYYSITPAEYCDKPNLRNCQATQTTAYKYPAPLRWCNSDANARAVTPAANSCQAVRTDNGYQYARFPTKFFTPGTAAVAGVPAVPASSTFTVATSGTCNNSNKASYSSVKVNGVELLSASTTPQTSANNIAGALRTALAGNTPGYSVSGSNSTVKLTAPVASGAITYGVVLTRASGGASCVVTLSPTSPAFSGYVAAVPAVPAGLGGFPGAFTRTDIIPTVTSYAKAATRTDCAAATTCTYDEEMTNFANWWTYYHTRMQAMKSSASLAFSPVSNQYRVGYMSINNNTGSDFLNPDQFQLTSKDNWFQKLVSARPGNSTPLRAALSKVGRLYAGKLSSVNSVAAVDPMQYSCQQNFTILSTDGYWNETANPKQINGTTDIGDQDSALPRPLLDGNATSNTLADVAAYYYGTDLRSSALGNCTSGSTSADVCNDNVPTGGRDVAKTQHMTTFTLGLGASGYMQFAADYLTATSGDFFDVSNGSTANAASGVCSWLANGATCNWPVPQNNAQTAIDDLWHAAVNGRGTYFSAGDPAAMYTGLSTALAQIKAQTGAAAAATTSNPNVSSGDNFVFISKFQSQEWSGELLGQQIDLTTGQVLTQSSDWSAQAKLDANTSRTIYTFDSSTSNKLKTFDWASLSTTEQGYFQTANITAAGQALSQFCSFGTTCLSAADQTAAAGQKLVDFLRGDRTNEGDLTDIGKYFRKRTHLLGDIVDSEAVYVKRVAFNYTDTGYSTYKTAQSTRQAMVYVGANDGMVHAFKADTGDELWSYVPSMLMPTLYKLADKDYANHHQYYVDSSPVSSDAYIGGQWRTLLVGGLGAGGRGYYALDITDPASPKALWEFTQTNLGLTFGKPEITKLKDGTWVVIVASGYNNVSPGDGVGRLYVINAATGALIRSIDTTAGSTATPSGMAQIRAWVDFPEVDNTVQRVYGGDNLGNVWRFDVNGDVGAAGYDAQLLATLRDTGGNVQPVTARPELGLTGGNVMVYVGTGRYLGISDLTDASQQSIYAIKDKLGSTSYGNPRATTNKFIQQTLTDTTCPANATVCAPGQTVRTGSSNAVDLNTDDGWYVDLPATRERANTDPQLALGTLVFTTNVIDNATACTVGGSSFINFFDYRTGAPVSTATGVISVMLGGALATRPSLIRLPNGKVVSLTRLSNDATVVSPVPIGSSPSGTRRVSWRELATEQ